MPETKPVAVKDLSLDLSNYRTVRQGSEAAAVEAMVTTSPDRFWALTESLLHDGYLPTETIIVLRTKGSMIVKEGNRRVGALKLILGLLPGHGIELPDGIAKAIKALPKDWKTANKTVPCAVYDEAEAATVDRIVALAHGKGERAGRDQWNAVARARHNRDANGVSESALDLLEKYLEQGKNVTSRQKALWSGDYPLSVLAEAMKRLAPRLGLKNATNLATLYPAVQHREGVEGIIHDIGREELRFEKIRDKDVDFASVYGIPAPAVNTGSTGNTGGTGSGKAGGSSTGKSGRSSKSAASGGRASTKQKALPITNPKAVQRLLKDFAPRGKKREKVETLRIEAVNLDVNKTPLAFCFVLRSMFEVSAKAYCADHAAAGLKASKSDGSDKSLADLLRDITNHLTKNNSDKAMVKALHGAMAELGKANGLLSVTSMNQLVHNPRFAISPSDISILFGNIFPLLEEMNS
jgi:hypothetical protein